LFANYLEATGVSAALFAFFAFFAFLDFFAFGTGASAEAAAAGAVTAGAAAWLAANEETANKPATRAAISFFIFSSSKKDD
jgi:hypothetical protein